MLNQDDLKTLLDWRDSHKDLVRSFPNPLRSVEIDFLHNNYRIIGIRKGYTLKLQLFAGHQSYGWAMFEYSKVLGALVGTKSNLKITKDSFQSVITVYCSLMALMVYGNESTSMHSELESEEIKGAVHKTAPRPSNTRKSNSTTTYIIRNANGRIQVIPRGSHAKPSGQFTVRGHYRHYKSGKVIWIAEYRKGTGSNKPKTYKIGGNRNESGDRGHYES